MDNNSKIILSVVIVSYNVQRFVLDAITSVYKFCNMNVQIIVADNNSTDDTINIIKQKFPDVTVISNKTNIGFSAANNQCFDICTGDYILMLNPDAKLIDDSLQKMITYLYTSINSELVLIAPKLINTDNSIQTSCWKFPSPFQHVLELFFLNTFVDVTKYNLNELQNEKSVNFLSGACILMKKTTLQHLKGLDVNLFWMDDVDLGKRNILNGGKNIYFPASTVKHHIGQSSKKNQNVVISNQIISKLKYYKKHQQYLYFYTSIPILFLQIISRIPLFCIIAIIKPMYFKKVKAYFYTLGKFFNYLIFGNQTIG